MTTSRIKTPHAAIKIWNYTDRIDSTGANFGTVNEIQEEIISTISCSQIQTFKSKSNPVGAFNLVLAPTRNWTATITPGSWCVIMMSDNSITKESFIKADPKLVKMIGRIDSVRAEVTINNEGARETKYLVSGQDWGQIFNNSLYIDPLLADPKNPLQNGSGNALYLLLLKMLFGRNGTPTSNTVTTNLRSLMGIFGRGIHIPDAPRLEKSTHQLLMPKPMASFFNFVDQEGKTQNGTELSSVIALRTGKLNADQTYTEVSDGIGWINPYTLVGSHTLWQILQDNSNYALNEMFTDIVWIDGKGPQLTLFNRIKPFSFQAPEQQIRGAASWMRSSFKNVPFCKLDAGLAISVNAGTNWKDKFNFLEVKPELNEFAIFDNWFKSKAQAPDPNEPGTNNIYNREGFRPLIFNIKQIPLKRANAKANASFTPEIQENYLQAWVRLMQEWYFDSHRMLNGQITLNGSGLPEDAKSDYIPVGNNIMFDAELLNITPNHNSKTTANKKYYILAQVESVKQNFSVSNDARTFQTTIDFVRGIIVDENRELVGKGTIDSLTIDYSKELSNNGINVIATGTVDTPSGE